MTSGSVGLRRLRFLLVFITAASVGCGGERGQTPLALEPTGRVFDGRVLKIMCPPEGPRVVLERYGRSWSRRTGASVTIVDRAPDSAASQPVDVLVLPARGVGRAVSRGKFTPVPAELTARAGRFRWPDLLQDYRSQFLVWDGTAVALPLVGENLVCCGRTDVPTTWQELVARAEALPTPALPPLPMNDVELLRDFYLLAAPLVRCGVHEHDQPRPGAREIYSFHFDLDTMEPRIGTAGFVAALKLMQRLQRCRPATLPAVREPSAEFGRGGSLFAVTSVPRLKRFQEADSPVRGRVQVGALPGSSHVVSTAGATPAIRSAANQQPYLQGGWIGMVPAGAQFPVTAFDLLAELAGPQTSQQILLDPDWGGGPFRHEHFTNRASWAGFGLDQPATDQLHEALQRTLEHSDIINPALCLRIPDADEYESILARGIRHALLAQNVDPADCLTDVARQWRQLADQKPLEQRRAEYRLSLGLAR